MNTQATARQRSRSELEVENEANRLTAQVEAALTALAMRSSDEENELDAAADRIERAARDLADALRGVAKERRL